MTKKTNYINPVDLEAEYMALHQRIQKVETDLKARRNEFTEAGFTAEWNRRVEPLRARHAELTGLADQWGASIANETRKARAEHFPEVTDQNRDSAERTAARYLNRNLDRDAAGKLLTDMPASAAKSIVFEELQARGVISPDVIHGLLCASDDTYLQSTRRDNHAQSTVSALNRRAGAIERSLNLRTYADPNDGSIRHTPQTKLSALEDVSIAMIPGAVEKRIVDRDVTITD